MTNWIQAPQQLTLAPHEVHLWLANLEEPTTPALEAFHAVLSPDEQQRAARFKFDKHRNKFISARGILRNLLARYLLLPAQDIELIYGEHGKPFLTNQDLQFNVAHSNELAVYAITLNHEIGIDVEYHREKIEMDKLAKRFFSAAEYEVFSQLPESQKRQAFFACWSRKEAFIKAIGKGLSYSLSKFDVALAPGETVAIKTIEGEATSSWHLEAFNTKEHYSAAFAIKANSELIRYYQWN